MSHLFRFRHLWPLKDLTLTTNQVRRWVHYLPQVGGGLSLELGPQSLLSLLSSPPPPCCRGARAALASRCGGRHPAFWVVLISWPAGSRCKTRLHPFSWLSGRGWDTSLRASVPAWWEYSLLQYWYPLLRVSEGVVGCYTPGGGSEGVRAGPMASGELLEKQILGSIPDILSQAQTVDLDSVFQQALGLESR